MGEIAYEWAWRQEKAESYLYIKFNRTETLSDCLACFSEALLDFDGGRLKVLIDLRLSENILTYNKDMAVLYDKFISMKVGQGIASLIVSDDFYCSKEKLVNEFAKINGKPFSIKSFDDYDTAKNWLIDYEFPIA